MLTFELLYYLPKNKKLLNFGLIVKTCPFEFGPYMITRLHLKTRMLELRICMANWRQPGLQGKKGSALT